MSKDLAPARYGILLANLLLLGIVLYGLLQWFNSPGEWRTPVPGQAGRSVWVEAENTGFVDQHLVVRVFLRDASWLLFAKDRHMGRYTSPLEDGPYHSVRFDFEWVAADTLYIYAQNHDPNQLTPTGKWLVAVIVPSRNQAL